MYAAGFYDNGTAPIACYWENGTKTDLYTDNSNANAIAVSGTEVYAAGWYEKSTGDIVACFCWNGTRIDLSTVNSQAYGIFVIE